MLMFVNKYFKISCCAIACFIAAEKVQAQSYVPEWNDTRFKVKPIVPVKAYSFNLKDVQLLNSPFKKAMQVNATYLLTIEPDRLLSAFRSHSGLQPKEKIYNGWESLGLAGHTLGHYLSAISMHYASTQESRFYDISYLIPIELTKGKQKVSVKLSLKKITVPTPYIAAAW